MVGKVEKAFSPFPTMFLPFLHQFQILGNISMVVCKCFEILSFGAGLNKSWVPPVLGQGFELF